MYGLLPLAETSRKLMTRMQGVAGSGEGPLRAFERTARLRESARQSVARAREMRERAVRMRGQAIAMRREARRQDVAVDVCVQLLRQAGNAGVFPVREPEQAADLDGVPPRCPSVH